MSRYKIKLYEIGESELSAIEKKIINFITDWNIEWKHYEHTGISFQGKGFAEDIFVLDCTVAEEVFGYEPEKFTAISSLIFGNCLKKLLNFQWCKFKLSSGYQLGLWHSYNDLLLPIEAMVANKLSTLYELYDCFADLFFQILCSVEYWPYGTHPLLDILKDPELYSEPGEYWGRWSVTFPEDIKKKFHLLLWHNEERCVREAGLEVYRWRNNPDWSQIRCSVNTLEEEYDKIFTPSWREKARKEIVEVFGEF